MPGYEHLDLRAGRAGHADHDRPPRADERDRRRRPTASWSTPGGASATTTRRTWRCSPEPATGVLRRRRPEVRRSTASRWWRSSPRSERARARRAAGLIGPSRWTDIYKPTIAAVNGVAYAGGLEWACWTDLAIADEHATFGVTCRRWNIGLADGGTQRLPRIVGMRRAMELIITGRVIDADEAERIGLVNEVVPSGDCVERALELAHSIAALPQPAIRTDKEAAVRGFGLPLDEGLRIEAECFDKLALQRRRRPRACAASSSATTRTAYAGGVPGRG